MDPRAATIYLGIVPDAGQLHVDIKQFVALPGLRPGNTAFVGAEYAIELGGSLVSAATTTTTTTIFKELGALLNFIEGTDFFNAQHLDGPYHYHVSIMANNDWAIVDTIAACLPQVRTPDKAVFTFATTLDYDIRRAGFIVTRAQAATLSMNSGALMNRAAYEGK